MFGDDDVDVVVIDNGSGAVKAAGIAGEDCPKVEFPCVAGRPKHTVRETLLLLRHDAVARLIANGSAAFTKSRAVIRWVDCYCSNSGP